MLIIWKVRFLFIEEVIDMQRARQYRRDNFRKDKMMEGKTVMMPRELTAENGAKGLLSGEFNVDIRLDCPECSELENDSLCDVCDGTGKYTESFIIPWTTIKAIYAMAVENLAT